MAGPGQQEVMVDQIKVDQSRSVTRCCLVLGCREATYYSRKRGNRPEQKDDHLAELLHKTTSRFIAWGFWKVFHYLRNEEHIKDNHKRVYRIWCREKLNLRLPPKRSRIYRTYQELLSPDGINEGWAMDFMSDWIVGPTNKRIRIINVMDEGSRRALWTEAHESISAKKLVEVLDQVVECRGVPAYIRCDNGPEFISQRLAKWAEKNGVEIRFTQPGKPTQNGLIERLNKTLRKECLNLTWFRSLRSLNEELQAWCYNYNAIRPHQNLGHQAPDTYEKEFHKFYYSPLAA